MSLDQGKTTVSLPQGKQLTVTAAALTTGQVTQKSVSVGEADQGMTLMLASTATKFGPYNSVQHFEIKSTAGSLSFAIAEVDYYAPEEAATFAQGATADTAKQPATVIALTAATLAITRALHGGNLIVVDKADGSTLTLPAATGTGTEIEVIVKTTITSVGLVIEVNAAPGTDTMQGGVLVMNDTDGSMSGFEALAASDTMTMNGTTTGGLKGDRFTLKDIATGIWQVTGVMAGTGSEATPFSAAVP